MGIIRLGGDMDDACSLAMLLGCPGVDIVGLPPGVTRGGRRASCVVHCLELAGRADIPLAAGGGASRTTLARAEPVVGCERHWQPTLARLPAPPGAAVDPLYRSIEQGAALVATGPFTISHCSR